MIDHHFPKFGIIDNPSFVIDNGFGIDSGCHGSPCINFRLDFVCNFSKAIQKVIVRAVFGNRSIGKSIDGMTLSRMVTGTTRIKCRA